MTPAALEVDAHDRRLFGKPSRAHAQHQPAARIHVERRGGLGGFDRIALGQQANAGADTDARGRLRGRRQRDERIGEMSVGLGHLAVGRTLIVSRIGGRDDQMLRDPERLEAGAFGRGRDRAGIAGFLGEECRDSDFHIVLQPRRGGPRLPAATLEGVRPRLEQHRRTRGHRESAQALRSPVLDPTADWPESSLRRFAGSRSRKTSSSRRMDRRASRRSRSTSRLNFTITRSEPRVRPKPGPTLYSTHSGNSPQMTGKI